MKRSNSHAAHIGSGESGSVFIARIKVLAYIAKLSNMDHMQHINFKLLCDLPAKVREKVLRQQDMTLDEMTTLVAESEAMDIINASLKPEQPKVPPSKGKPKEEAMPAVKKPLKKKKTE